MRGSHRALDELCQSDNALVAVRRKNCAALRSELYADWVVFGPVEAARKDFLRRPVLDDCTLVKIWDALPALDSVRLLPGRPWRKFEACFHLYRRKARSRDRAEPSTNLQSIAPCHSSNPIELVLQGRS